jgi:hypothetical protein
MPQKLSSSYDVTQQLHCKRYSWEARIYVHTEVHAGTGSRGVCL